MEACALMMIEPNSCKTRFGLSIKSSGAKLQRNTWQWHKKCVSMHASVSTCFQYFQFSGFRVTLLGFGNSSYEQQSTEDNLGMIRSFYQDLQKIIHQNQSFLDSKPSLCLNMDVDTHKCRGRKQLRWMRKQRSFRNKCVSHTWRDNWRDKSNRKFSKLSVISFID